MASDLHFTFEIEAVAPDNARTVQEYFQTSLREAMGQSGLEQSLAGEPEVTFEQHLPVSKEQLEMLTIGLAFVFKEGPQILQQVQALSQYLLNKLRTRGETTIGFKVRVGGREIEGKNLSPEDTIRILTATTQIEIRPRKVDHD